MEFFGAQKIATSPGTLQANNCNQIEVSICGDSMLPTFKNGDKILFKKPTSFAKPIALIKKGRLLIVERCEKNWCEIKTDNFNGWIKTDDLWGLTN